MGVPQAAVSASAKPWFGRAWNLTVTTQNGEQLTVSNNAWEPEALRVTFTVEQFAFQAWWYADISIWNLNQATEQFLLSGTQRGLPSTGTTSSGNIAVSQGDLVVLSAGYQADTGSAGPIWTGPVFQPMWDRIDGTDFVLTLHCVLGLQELAPVSVQVGPLATQVAIVKAMAAQAQIDVDLDSEGEQILSQAQLPRKRAIWGTPETYFQQIAAANRMRCWLSERGFNLVGTANQQTAPSIIYGPSATPGTPINTTGQNYTPTLIGVPQQTQEGVSWRTLLDSRLRVGQLVGLNQSAIRQIAQYPLQQSGPTVLSQDGTYFVGGVKHIGDTRGIPWYSDVTAVTPLAWQSALRKQSGSQSQ